MAGSIAVNGELEGKVAVITGAASGIGLATSRLFVHQGAKVVLADVDRDAGGSAAASLGESAAFIHADVTRTEDVQAATELASTRFGALDVMFNNAGIPGAASALFADDDLADFHRVMEVSPLGVMIGCQLAARAMATCGSGSIINTGSLGGTLPGLGVASYRAANAALYLASDRSAYVTGVALAVDGARHRRR